MQLKRLASVPVCALILGCSPANENRSHESAAELFAPAPARSRPPVPSTEPSYPSTPQAACTTLAALPSLWATPRPVAARVFGYSVQKNPLVVEHWGPTTGPQVLVIAQVHGDECGGLLLADSIRRRPPTSYGVWLVPTLNPDGAMSFQRRNASMVDLNRDGLALTQPESSALMDLTRALRPLVTVHVHSPYGWIGFYGNEPARSLARESSTRLYNSPPRFAGSNYGFLWEGQAKALPGHPSLLVEFPAVLETEATQAPLADERRMVDFSRLSDLVEQFRLAMDASIGPATAARP